MIHKNTCRKHELVDLFHRAPALATDTEHARCYNINM